MLPEKLKSEEQATLQHSGKLFGHNLCLLFEVDSKIEDAHGNY